MDRRQFLATLGTSGIVATVGCTGLLGSSTPQQATDPWRGVSTEEGSRSQVVRGSVVLPSGTFAVRTLNPQRQVRFEAQLDTGEDGPMDLIVIPEGEYGRYREGERYTYLQGYSALDRSEADLDVAMAPDDYYVIFDNTASGEATPSGEIRADFALAVSV